MKFVLLTLLVSRISFAFSAKDLPPVECTHHTDDLENADMSVHFKPTDAEDMVRAIVSVRTSINNDHNWFVIYDDAVQVSAGEKSVSIDSDDAKVSLTIKLPIPKQNPNKPNAKLTFEGDREFSRFRCQKR